MQKRKSMLGLALCLVLGLMMPHSEASATITTLDFESVDLGPNGYLNGSDLSGGFSVDGAFLNNTFSFGCCWEGWALSNQTDVTTSGFLNQYSAFPGSGAGGSSQYAVAFSDQATITLPFATTVIGADFTNTTFAALSMLTGSDPPAKKFGGVTGSDPDFFNVSIGGYRAGAFVNSVVFDLADYTGTTSQDYVLSDWVNLDLSILGIVDELRFTFDSSDIDPRFGINTPTYIAMDNFQFIPEPSTAWTLALGLVALAGGRRAHRGRLRQVRNA